MDLPVELLSVFGFEKDQQLARRSLTPSETSDIINGILESKNISMNELAGKLVISTSVLRDLCKLQRIPISVRERYLSPLWRPLDGDRKLMDRLSFTAMAEVAKSIRDDGEADIAEAVALAARYNLGKLDLRDLGFIRTKNPGFTLTKAVEKVQTDKGIFATVPKNIDTIVFVAECARTSLSSSQLIQVKSAVESRIGPIVDVVEQNGPLVSISLLSGKTSENLLERYISSEDVQQIVTDVSKGGM